MSGANTLSIYTLEESSTHRYQENLEQLIAIIEQNSDVELFVAPEVYLTGFDYEHMQTAATFALSAEKSIKKALLPHQSLVITLIKQEEEGYVNQAVFLHNNKVVHKHNKSKLFYLGEEHKHFVVGKSKKVKHFEYEGISYAVLICFELRFKELWTRCEGAQVVIVPAQWGKLRAHHLLTLAKGLAVMNQCFVVVSNSANEEMGGGSVIVNPDGKGLNKQSTIDLTEVSKMRRYINTNKES